MIAWLVCLLVTTLAAGTPTAILPEGVDAGDRMVQLGVLDVTKAPYRADPTGAIDATNAIQRAADDARDYGLVCFLPEGTYLISDTISCQIKMTRLATPKHIEGGSQHYWPIQRPIVLMGSTKGRRPVLKLSDKAQGFDDPARPKVMIYIWAQTYFDAPGKDEPVWGKEQPNISFNHFFKGIDIDIRGHAGAIGIRHSGSQGSTLQDVKIDATGAYAGMNNCCGQGGGTYNVEVLGGRYGIVIDPDSRFPLLTACHFQGQQQAAIRYAKGGSQVPTLLVGCGLEPAGDVAVDLSTERGYAGLIMVDCVIDLRPGSTICKTKKRENIYLEDVSVRGAATVCTDDAKKLAPEQWTSIERYSSHTAGAVNSINGVETSTETAVWRAARSAPDLRAICRKHYRGTPSFEDADAVNVKSFGAVGDGTTDDTKAFEQAIASQEKIFVPKGRYKLSGSLRLRPKTQLFGLSREFCLIGDFASGRGQSQRGGSGENFSLETPDDADAAPGLTFLTVRGRLQWKSGQGTWMLSAGPIEFSGNGGGRIYGLMALRQPFIVKGVRQPLSFYALNVERVTTNPQSEIEDCEHVRIYYYKVEAGTLQQPNAGDDNTPSRIARSRDLRIYCMYGNVVKLIDKPMLEVVDSSDLVVCQLKAFRPGQFAHLREISSGQKSEVPSSKPCALYLRNSLAPKPVLLWRATQEKKS